MIFSIEQALLFDVEEFMHRKLSGVTKSEFNNLVNVLQEQGICNASVKKVRNERFCFTQQSVVLVSWNHDSEACGIFVTNNPQLSIIAGDPHPIAQDKSELIRVWANGNWDGKKAEPWDNAIRNCLNAALDLLRKKTNHAPVFTGEVEEIGEAEKQKELRQSAKASWLSKGAP